MENSHKKLRPIILFIMIFWIGTLSNIIIEHTVKEETIDKIVYRLADPKTARIILAMIQVESGGNSQAISKTNDYGLLQINRLYWSKTYDFDKILEPEYNIQAGIEILNLCLKQSKNDLRLALQYYNGSPKYPWLINKKHKELFGEDLL